MLLYLPDPDPEWIDFADKSINIDQWDKPGFDWNQDIPFITVAEPISGELTSSAPIDVVHWTGTCTVSPTGMEHWESCLVLLTHT